MELGCQELADHVLKSLPSHVFLLAYIFENTKQETEG